jgi:hypothetical protein
MPEQYGEVETAVLEPRFELRALAFSHAQLHERISRLHPAAERRHERMRG